MELLKPAVVGGGDVNAGRLLQRRTLEHAHGRVSSRLTAAVPNLLITTRRIRGIAHQGHGQGQPPAEANFQRVGPRRSPHAAGRLGRRSRRARQLARTTRDDPTCHSRRRHDQLGHPRRLADDRGSRQDRRRAVRGPIDTETLRRHRRRRQLPGAGPRPAASRRSSARSRRADHAIGPYDPMLLRPTRCSRTARSTRVTRRCRPRRST